MAIKDPELFAEFCKNDYRLKGAKSSQPNEMMRNIHRELVDANKLLSGGNDQAKTKPIKSADVIGRYLGVSAKVIENCRIIVDYAPKEIQNKVLRRTLSISQAVAETREYQNYQKSKRKPGGTRGEIAIAPLVHKIAQAYHDTIKEIPHGKSSLRNYIYNLADSLYQGKLINEVVHKDILSIVE